MYVWPAAIGALDTSGTPSIAAGTSRPCQWIDVGESGNWFRTRMRNTSPSRTRTSGPGRRPLASTAGTGCAPSGAIDAGATANVYSVRFGRGTSARAAGVATARATRVPASAVAPSAAPCSSARRLSPRDDPSPPPPRLAPRIAILLLACGALTTLCPSPAWCRHLARLDPTEPIFTQRAFVEKNLELDTSWDKTSTGNALEMAPGVSWVFAQRLELDAEVPFGLQIPRQGATVGSLGDIAF